MFVQYSMFKSYIQYIFACTPTGDKNVSSLNLSQNVCLFLSKRVTSIDICNRDLHLYTLISKLFFFNF